MCFVARGAIDCKIYFSKRYSHTCHVFKEQVYLTFSQHTHKINIIRVLINFLKVGYTFISSLRLNFSQYGGHIVTILLAICLCSNMLNNIAKIILPYCQFRQYNFVTIYDSNSVIQYCENCQCCYIIAEYSHHMDKNFLL